MTGCRGLDDAWTACPRGPGGAVSRGLGVARTGPMAGEPDRNLPSLREGVEHGDQRVVER